MIPFSLFNVRTLVNVYTSHPVSPSLLGAPLMRRVLVREEGPAKPRPQPYFLEIEMRRRPLYGVTLTWSEIKIRVDHRV